MRKFVLVFLGLFFGLSVDVLAEGFAKVQSLRFWNEAGQTRVVFDLSSVAAYRIFMLEGPDRVVVDLENARLAARVQQPSSSHPLFKRIRYARRNQNDLRVVLDLKEKVKPESFVLDPNSRYGHRLVVDLYARHPAPGARTRASGVAHRRGRIEKGSPVAVEQEGPQKSVSKNRVSGAGEAASSPARPKVVTNSSNSSKSADQHRKTSVPNRTQDFVVAIDAGHGGNDPGAKGAHGTREKDVVLKIAKKLHRLIAREPGMRAVLVREGDYYLGLRNRMRVARDANADIFVSIHADAFRRSDIRGSSVYTLSQRGASSEAARWLAAKENAADLIGGVSLDDKDDMVAELLLDLSQTATLDASVDLANKVLRNLGKLGKVHKRQVQNAGFVVLKSPDIPSILVETAFISNPYEEKQLNSPAYQDRLARALFNGIRDYYRLRAMPAMHMADRKHVIEPGETLSGIAQMYGLSTRQLRAANTIPGDEIKAGQILNIPAGS